MKQLMIASALVLSMSIPALGQHDHHGGHSAPAHGSTDHAAPATQPALRTPAAIAAEHAHLHHDLAAARAAGGKTAEAAAQVEAVLAPHFELEEAFAMPPLGLLPALSRGETIPADQAAAAIAMAEKLEAHYPGMIEEHGRIRQALKALEAAATAENKPDQARFAATLLMHAQNEEQVLYPTTLLIGRVLRQQAAAGQGHHAAPGAAADGKEGHHE